MVTLTSFIPAPLKHGLPSVSRGPHVQPNPTVSIVVLVTSETRRLETCLDSIQIHSRPSEPYEIIVLANGTPPGTLSRIEARSDIVLIRSSVNHGFGGGCNWAVRFARAERLLFLNDDILVEPGWLDELVQAMDSDPTIGAVGSKVVAANGRLQEAGSVIWRDGSTSGVGRGEDPSDAAYCYRRDSAYVSFCSALVRRAAWTSVSGFDERYFPAYYEDADICLSLSNAGWRVVYEPKSVVVHSEYGSTHPDFRAFLFRHNRELFVDKWAPVLDALPPPPEGGRVGGFPQHKAAGTAARPRLLIVDDCEPDPGLGAGFGRMAEAVEELASSYDITFIATDRGVITREPWLVRRREETRSHLSDLGVQLRIDDLEYIQRERPSFDAVLLSRPTSFMRAGALIKRYLADTPIVYDTEALWSRRLHRMAALASGADARSLNVQAARIASLECKAVDAAAIVVCLSDEEAAIVHHEHTDARVLVLPYPPKPHMATKESFDERSASMIFAASWIAGPESPNLSGLLWFAGEVLPRVRTAVPWTRLYVTGANPPARATQLQSPHLTCTGFVHELSSLYATSRVAVCPILFGSGVKLKTVDALSYGIPVVATTVGAEGVEGAGSALSVADDPASFASRCVELLTHRDAWQSAHEDARAMARRSAKTAPGRATWSTVVAEAWRKHAS